MILHFPPYFDKTQDYSIVEKNYSYCGEWHCGITSCVTSYQNIMSYSFTNLEILETLELIYQFITFFAEMFGKMPETVLYALMPNVTRFFLLTTLSIKNI